MSSVHKRCLIAYGRPKYVKQRPEASSEGEIESVTTRIRQGAPETQRCEERRADDQVRFLDEPEFPMEASPDAEAFAEFTEIQEQLKRAA